MTIEKKAEIGNIIAFRRENHKRDPDVCQHNKVVFDVHLENITCQDCKEKINPVVWLDNHLQVIKSYHDKSLERMARAEVIEERLEKKARFFCNKCGDCNEINFDKLINLKQLKEKFEVLESQDAD